MVTPIHVIGHVNPDTDAIASALGYAWLLRERDGKNAIAARAGALSAQTSWVLKTLGLDPPQYFADASPRCDRIARTLPPILPDRPLREAWTVAASHSSAPIVDAGGIPLGLVTGASVFRWFSRQIEKRIDLEHVSLAKLLTVASAELMDPEVPRFSMTARVRDVRARVLREERDDFFVTREDGTYFGVCRTPDVLHPPRMQVVLVDHNEAAQAIGALDEADLLEVLDHHRLGNPHTKLPIPFIVDPVGSTSTLVWERIRSAAIAPPAPIAGALLAGLMADTLILRSPTTTSRDHAAAAELARHCLPSDLLRYPDAAAYGQAVLAAGSGFAVQKLEQILNSDLKLYTAAEMKFGIAQVEVPNVLEIGERLGEIRAGLASLCDARGLGIGVLMVTDVVRNASRLVLAGPHVERLNDLPYKRLPDGTLEAPDVVSRKKQLLPAILGLIG